MQLPVSRSLIIEYKPNLEQMVTFSKTRGRSRAIPGINIIPAIPEPTSFRQRVNGLLLFRLRSVAV